MMQVAVVAGSDHFPWASAQTSLEKTRRNLEEKANTKFEIKGPNSIQRLKMGKSEIPSGAGEVM